MERKISFDDVQKAVDNAYEQYKSVKKGEINPLVKDTANEKDFGIAVVLTDGRVVRKADADAKYPIGNIARVVVQTVLMEQNTPEEIVKKSGTCCKCHHHDGEKVKLPVNRHALRAVSAIEPTGDPEGKYNLLVNTLIDMIGGETPEFDDKLYEQLTKDCADANVADQLAKEGFELYDDVLIAVNVYNKLRSLRLSSEQVATLAATIAADGVNPKTDKVVFDGSKAASIVTLMATVGKHRAKRAFLMKAGLPYAKSFAGGVVAVLPGFGAIAAYSPEICDNCKMSVKGKHAVESIARELGLNIFASARVTVG